MATPIALCITDLNVGGAEGRLAALATRIDRSQFTPTVYCLASEPGLGESSVVPILRAAGVEVCFLGVRRRWSFFQAVRRLSVALRERQTELIQSFLFHANAVGRLAARWAGVRCVLSGIRVAERRSHGHLWLDRATDRFVDRHVCVSQSVALFAENTIRLPKEKLVVIPNGVDLARFSGCPAADLLALGIDRNRTLVTFIGRLDRQKGVAWLLDTAPDWLGRLANCDLLLVGKGPDEDPLRAQCTRLGIASRVHFVGWRSDIPEILAASSVLVLPSRWEGMPNVILEAMASGLPVVANDVEGVRELLGDQSAEQLVPTNDPKSFSDKVVTLIDDRDFARELGQTNRLRAETNFSQERMISAYENLWRSLLASSVQPPRKSSS